MYHIGVAIWARLALADLDEPREHRRADRVRQARLALQTPLDELDLAGVQRAPEIRHEGAVKRIRAAGCTRACTMQHPREPVGGVEKDCDGGCEGVRAWWASEEAREGGRGVGEELGAHFWGACFNGGGEGLTAPDGGDGWVACEEVFVDAGELDVGLARGGDDEAVDDAVGDGFGHGVSEEGLDEHGGGGDV